MLYSALRTGRTVQRGTNARSGSERGGVLVEFAITLPFLILIMSGLFQISSLISMYGPSGNVAYLAAMTGAQIPNSVGSGAMVARGSELMEHLNSHGLLSGDSVSVTAGYGPQNTSTATVTGAVVQLWPGFSVPMTTTFTVPVLAKDGGDDLDDGFGTVPEQTPSTPCGKETSDCKERDDLVDLTASVNEMSKYAATEGIDEFYSSLKVAAGRTSEEGYWGWYKTTMGSYEAAAEYFAPILGKLTQDEFELLSKYCGSSELYCQKILEAEFEWSKALPWAETGESEEEIKKAGVKGK